MLTRLLAPAFAVLVSLAPAAADSLKDVMARAQRTIDEARRRDGFPPQSDMVGTTIECDRRIKAAQQGFLTCAGARARRLSASSPEPSATLADAIIAGCPAEREALVRSAYPYCIHERQDAEAAVEGFARKARDTVLAVIVEYRAQSATPLPGQRTRPDTRL